MAWIELKGQSEYYSKNGPLIGSGLTSEKKQENKDDTGIFTVASHKPVHNNRYICRLPLLLCFENILFDSTHICQIKNT